MGEAWLANLTKSGTHIGKLRSHVGIMLSNTCMGVDRCMQLIHMDAQTTLKGNLDKHLMLSFLTMATGALTQ